MQVSQKADAHEILDGRKRPEVEFREEGVPPIFEAAIPVLAVTETTAGFFTCFFLRAAMIARSRSDFPVPGRPKALG